MYNETEETIEVKLTIPRYQRGQYTYDPEVTYCVDNVCVYINYDMCDYSLCTVNYLDYKDSQQVGGPIITFETEEEAIKFAEKFSLFVEFSGASEAQN